MKETKKDKIISGLLIASYVAIMGIFAMGNFIKKEDDDKNKDEECLFNNHIESICDYANIKINNNDEETALIHQITKLQEEGYETNLVYAGDTIIEKNEKYIDVYKYFIQCSKNNHFIKSLVFYSSERIKNIKEIKEKTENYKHDSGYSKVKKSY